MRARIPESMNAMRLIPGTPAAWLAVAVVAGSAEAADVLMAIGSVSRASAPPAVSAAVFSLVPRDRSSVATHVGPDFPPVPRDAVAYEQADEDLHLSAAEGHEGRLRSRYVLRRDGTFVLWYSSPRYGLYAYPGRYEITGPKLRLAFGGHRAWFAEATRDGPLLNVRYAWPMVVSDFRHGAYVRVEGSS